MSLRYRTGGSVLLAGWRWPCRAPFLLAVVGLLVIGTGRAVAVAPPRPTAITILRAPTETTIGQDITISARITAAGQPVTSRLLVLQLDGTTLRTASVDQNGVAQFAIRGSEISRAHTATVLIRFPGAPTLTASDASFTLVVKPAQVTIETVPSIDGLSLSLGTMTAVTIGGVATFEVPTIGQYALIPNIAASASGSVRVDFVRWSDEVFTAARDVSVTGNLALQLGLRLAYRGSIVFRDASGALLDPSEIDSVTLTSTSGLGETLTGNYQNIWLEGGTAVKGATGPGTAPGVQRATGLVASPRSWRVVGVWIHGTNVVNRGQQSAQPAAGAVWEVTVLLFDLSVEAHDAILGFPLSGTLELEYPDHTIVTVKLGSSSALDFRRLPRGDYTLRLHAGGLAASTPVALSRSQSTVIRVITIVDLAMAGSVALIAVVALLWFGRRRQFLRIVTGTQQRLAMGWQAASSAAVRSGRTTRTRFTEITSRISPSRHSTDDAGRSALSMAEVMRRVKTTATPNETLKGDPDRSSRGSAGGAGQAAISRRRGAATCPSCGRFVSAQARRCASCGFTIPGSAG